MFFAISGFLITSNVIRRYSSPTNVDLGQFYAMRVARIFPPLLLFIAAAFGLAFIGPRVFWPPSYYALLNAALSALTFQYNWFYLTGGNVPGLFHWSPLWSLSIEEIFYIVFPILCFLTRRASILSCFLLVAVIAGPLFRTSVPGSYTWWGCADLLAFGCLSAMALNALPFRWRRPEIAIVAQAVGLIGIAAIYATMRAQTDTHLVPTLLAGATATFLFGAGIHDWRAKVVAFVTWPLQAFGRSSYEIYIFHLSILLLVGPAQIATWFSVNNRVVLLLINFIFLASLLTFGLVMSRLFSEPLNRSIRAFYKTTLRDRAAASEGPVPRPIMAEPLFVDSIRDCLYRADTANRNARSNPRRVMNARSGRAAGEENDR